MFSLPLCSLSISSKKISTMAKYKFMSPLIPVLIVFTFVKDCHSISPAMPPDHPWPAPVPPSPSYIAGPGMDPYTEVTPYHAVPASDPHTAVPTSPVVPAPESYLAVPTIPEFPAPNSSPPVSEPGPTSPEPYPSLPVPRRFRGIKAAYWPSFNDFPASSIDTSYFTHIYYAFLLPEPNTFKLNVTLLDHAKLLELVGTLRVQNSHIKILLSIGGGGNDPNVFSKMASTKETRAIFINSTIEIARKYGFDGVDLDWEFPANDQDMSNLALLFKQWRTSINQEARITNTSPLLLTAAVYFASRFTIYGGPRGYPIEAINKYMNWVSPMCFDYHGSWENFTGLHAALNDPRSNISTSYGIGSWIQAGVPAQKLVMGLPLYGRTWKLKDPDVNGIGAPALGVGPGDGVLTYNQIVKFNMEGTAAVVFDATPVAYHSFAGDSWIGYDDVLSIKLKVQFAKSKGLGGYFFWAIGQDKDWTLSKQGTLISISTYTTYYLSF